MSFFSRKTHTTEEEVISYFYGDEYLKELSDTKKKKKDTKEKNKKLISPEERSFRRAKLLVTLIIVFSFSIIAFMASVIFYPKMLYHIGLVKKPPVLSMSFTPENDKLLSIKMKEETEVIWQNSDFVYGAAYKIKNISEDKYLYPIIKVYEINQKGNKNLIAIFYPLKEVVEPNGEVTGLFMWEKNKSINSKKIEFVWQFETKDSDIINPPEENQENEPIDINDVSDDVPSDSDEKKNINDLL